jgi:hypothetical protein
MHNIKKTGAGGEIYSNKTADRLSNQWGVDVADELTKLLSEELAKSIDSEILKSLGVLSIPERRKKSLNKIYKSKLLNIILYK